jgi:hypothetical protein
MPPEDPSEADPSWDVPPDDEPPHDPPEDYPPDDPLPDDSPEDGEPPQDPSEEEPHQNMTHSSVMEPPYFVVYALDYNEAHVGPPPVDKLKVSEFFLFPEILAHHLRRASMLCTLTSY